MLHPGESCTWSANGDALLAEYAVDDVNDVVVYDDIGREYRPAEGMLHEILKQWNAAGERRSRLGHGGASTIDSLARERIPDLLHPVLLL